MAKKAKTTKSNPEQRLKENLDSSLRDLIKRKHNYSNPTKTFKVGQQVYHIGFWNNIFVKDSYENLFYLVEYEATDNNYGNPITRKAESWVPWVDLYESIGSKEVLNKRQENLNSNVHFSNRSLRDLLSKYYYFGINLDPAYQKGLVWSEADKVHLIDSIFNGIEIGKFAFIHLDFETGKPSYEILDGKQRLTTIIEFIEDRFKYKGLCFSELSQSDKRYFEDYNITVGESRGQLTEAEKMRYFLRLNIGGIPQSEEHLKKVAKLLEKEMKKNKK